MTATELCMTDRAGYLFPGRNDSMSLLGTVPGRRQKYKLNMRREQYAGRYE